MNQKLSFCCKQCESQVRFFVFTLLEGPLVCRCGAEYRFEDENLVRQVRLFEDLCVQVKKSQEILDQTCVGIDVGDKHVEIPYKILLSRMNAVLHLRIGGEKVCVEFRMEPFMEESLVKS